MKTNSTFGVIFFTRKFGKNPQGLKIYTRITVNSRRAEISLKRSVEADLWDNAKDRAKGYSPENRRLNAYLDEVYSQLLDCHKQLLSELKVITPDAIKKRFLGEDEQQKTLMQLVTYHNESMVHTLKPGTMKNYYTTEKYLKAFLKEKLKVNDIYLKQLNYRFITDFEYYLRTCKPKTRKQQNNNGTMKHLERVRKMMNLALKLEWLEKDPFRKFQLKFTKTDRQYLTEHELQQLETTDL
ncbi:phage integrase SAM-like domain-containing protein [Sinomicrobium kalidii]|uniref:phage integrase SAM-like domain and Arm DNA-binding domain-containing protein n=1 Tax=Sinomicrobium kalidii TaxID=2900738 RepID=UPI001E3F3664|nr:phage integrase SAM-like domain and Arm DNA-binding domain-containing protein [Sinomicrobium kalidii]UGU15956.1 phage integrase SAM-like domain-containing protein [Sinomicrobium kalidii]